MTAIIIVNKKRVAKESDNKMWPRWIPDFHMYNLNYYISDYFIGVACVPVFADLSPFSLVLSDVLLSVVLGIPATPKIMKSFMMIAVWSIQQRKHSLKSDGLEWPLHFRSQANQSIISFRQVGFDASDRCCFEDGEENFCKSNIGRSQPIWGSWARRGERNSSLWGNKLFSRSPKKERRCRRHHLEFRKEGDDGFHPCFPPFVGFSIGPLHPSLYELRNWDHSPYVLLSTETVDVYTDETDELLRHTTLTSRTNSYSMLLKYSKSSKIWGKRRRMETRERWAHLHAFP